MYSKASRKFNCNQDIGRLYGKRYMNVIGSNYPGIDRLFVGGAIVFGPLAVEVFNTKRMPIKADDFKGVVGDSNGRLSDDDYSKVVKGGFDLSDIEYINNLPERNGNKVIYIDGEKPVEFQLEVKVLAMFAKWMSLSRSSGLCRV